MHRSIAVAVTATALALPVPAYANPDVAYEGDRYFIDSLNEKGVLFNFKLQRYQALRACDDLSNGTKPIDAVRELQNLGDYSFNVASMIVTAGSVAYCPWISWAQ